MTTLVESTRPESDMNSRPRLIVVTEDFQMSTGSHRCDRCSHAACYEVSLQSGGKLLFCMHHFRENQTALRSPMVTEIRDESKQLYK